MVLIFLADSRTYVVISSVKTISDDDVSKTVFLQWLTYSANTSISATQVSHDQQHFTYRLKHEGEVFI